MTAPFNDRLDFEVIGFRQWKVNEDLRMTSSAQRHEWTAGVNEAECKKVPMPAGSFHWGTGASPEQQRCEHAPGNGCECGLYALHTPEFWYGPDAAQQGMSMFMFGGGEVMYVAGLVSAWGRMEVHHNGFRAQYAQPVAIALPDRKRDAAIARGVAAEYGLPLVPQSELERIAPEFGSTVPESMRPEKPKPSKELSGLANIIIGGNYLTYPSAPTLQYRWYTLDTSVTTPKPGDTIEELARRNKPKYDPRRFTPKHGGGLA